MLKSMFDSLAEYFVVLRTRWSRLWHDTDVELLEDRSWLKYALVGTGVVFIFLVVVSFFWSSEPSPISIEDKMQAYIPSDRAHEKITGVATTVALISVAETLLEKPGGFLTNDILPPGVWLDNIPSWEYGALTQVRDLARGMREAFSRSQTQSREDMALKDAEAQLNFDNKSWALPQTEDEYVRGINALKDYLGRLTDHTEQNAQFYARADNLRYWLGTVETRLGSLSQVLSASVGQRRLNTDLAGDSAAKQATSTPNEMQVKTTWFDIDNVFYQARGSSWALIVFLKAVEIDFEEVLDKKNARVSLQQIIRELEGTQEPLYSPMVLNGSGFGVLANHSLVMASYISRANAAIIDLRELLSKG